MTDPSADPFLAGERVALTPLSVAHLDGPYVSWLNDPAVSRYNSHHSYPYTREMAEEYIRSLAGGPNLVLAIVLRDDGRHIGNISLQDVHSLYRTAEFAILLGDRSAWGHGYGTEAGHLALRHGFLALNLHRVGAGTLVENLAMRRLAENLGMTLEGVRREAIFNDGQHRDVALYGVLAREYLHRFGRDE